jgi:hypothetical protein
MSLAGNTRGKNDNFMCLLFFYFSYARPCFSCHIAQVATRRDNTRSASVVKFNAVLRVEHRSTDFGSSRQHYVISSRTKAIAFPIVAPRSGTCLVAQIQQGPFSFEQHAQRQSIRHRSCLTNTKAAQKMPASLSSALCRARKIQWYVVSAATWSINRVSGPGVT